MTSSESAIPDCFKPLRQLDRHCSWSEALELLAQAGFETRALANRPGKSADEGQRSYALLSHPEGFLVAMSSYATGRRHALNTLCYYQQIDIGADIERAHRESFGSGSRVSQGDGTTVFQGQGQVVPGHCGAMGFMLEDSYANARPLPFECWSPMFTYIDPGLFTSAPADAVHGGREHQKLAFEFAETIKADWSAFISALPADLAAIIAPVQQDGAVNEPFHAPIAVNDYFSQQLKSSGDNWPSESDSALMISWSQAIDQLRSERSEFKIGAAQALRLAFFAQGPDQPLSFEPAGAAASPASPELFVYPRFNERLSGGACLAHALASSPVAHYDIQSGLTDPVCDFILSLPPDQARETLSFADARGRSPVGVAFEAWLSDSSLASEPITPFMALCLEKGWLGAPGELAQALYDSLGAPAATRLYNDIRPRFELAHARLIDQIDTASRQRGHDWLVPLRIDGALIEDPMIAISALMEKSDPKSGMTREYLEALSLRLSLRAPSAPSALALRL